MSKRKTDDERALTWAVRTDTPVDDVDALIRRLKAVLAGRRPKARKAGRPRVVEASEKIAG